MVEEERLSTEALARRTKVNEAEHPLGKCVDRQSNFSGSAPGGWSLLATYSAASLTGWLGIIGRVTAVGCPDKLNRPGLQD